MEYPVSALNAGFELDKDSLRTLWLEYNIQGSLDYDNFIALLTRMQILKGNIVTFILVKNST